MPLPKLRHDLREYHVRAAFLPQRGAGLLSDVFPNTFTPSVGHPEAIHAVSSEPLPRLRRFVQDTCFRAIDLNRVGYGPHLSLFEMSVSLRLTEFSRDACIAEIECAFEALINIVGLNPRSLFITTYPGGTVLGTHIAPDDWSSDTWHRLGVPGENIIPAPGDACVLAPDAVREPAGVRSEVFYQPLTGAAPFEIATLEFLQYRMRDESGAKSLELLPTRSGLLATAFGLERLDMAVASLPSIFDVDEVRVVVDRVVAHIGSPTLYAIQPLPYRIVADACRAIVAILAAGQPLDRSRRGQVARTVIGRIVRASRELGAQPRELVAGVLTEQDSRQPWATVLLDALPAK